MENYKVGLIKEKPFLMAELLVKSNGRGTHKVMPRIDLTPMVDLGFLLITFFMMTTTMAKPKAMSVQMPSIEHTEIPTAFYESSAITLMPASKHVIYYYEGIFNPDIPFKKVSDAENIRKILAAKKVSLSHREKPEERDVQVIIKSHPSSTVNDMIALLDEMKISGIKYYAMVDISPEEALLIDKKYR